MFLASRGNVLFGDWGLPLGTLSNVIREQLLARRKLNQYIYPHVHHRLYEDLTASVPLTLVVDQGKVIPCNLPSQSGSGMVESIGNTRAVHPTQTLKG